MSMKFEQTMNRFSDWMSANKVLRSVSAAFMMILPIIILGSIFTLLVGLNLPAYQTFITSTSLRDYFALVPAYTTSWIAIYLTLAMAYQYSLNIEARNDRFVIVLLSLLAFLLVTPLTPLTQADQSVMNFLSFEWLGSQGMFSALVIPIGTAQIYRLFMVKSWTIKMPESVPPAIQQSFQALIPSFVIAGLFIGLNGLFALTPFEHFHALIYGLFLLPLQHLSNNLFTMLLLILLMHIIWFFGMHGTMLLGPVLLLMLTSATLANTQAYAVGEALPNILTLGFLTSTMLGGIGSTLALSIMMLFAKSQRIKTLSRISLVPSLFGINEPIIFGLPVVLNTTLMIPFIVTPLVNALLLYGAMSMQWVQYPALMNLPTGTPVLMEGLLQMGWSGVVAQVVLFVVDFVIYYPFFKKIDQQALTVEGETHA